MNLSDEDGVLPDDLGDIRGEIDTIIRTHFGSGVNVSIATDKLLELFVERSEKLYKHSR